MKVELLRAFVEGFKDSFRLAADLVTSVYTVLAAFVMHTHVEIKTAEPPRRSSSRT